MGLGSSTEGELSLTEVILVVREYLKAGLRVWWLILLGMLLGGTLLAWKNINTPPRFGATLTFMIDEETGSGGGSYGFILGQFGLGGGGSEYNLTKIIELAESQKILFEVLLDSALIEGKNELIANHIVSLYSEVEQWNTSDEAVDFYVHGAEFSDFSRDQRKNLLRIYLRLLDAKRGRLISAEANEGTGIMRVMGSTLNENLSVELTVKVYEELSQFYVLENTGNSRNTIALLKAKADSLKKELSLTEYKLARIQDRASGTFRKIDNIQQQQLQREVGMLSIAYGEIVRNLETATFALGNTTPFFQPVDWPFTPLPLQQPSWLLGLIGGMIVGGVMVFFIVVIVKLYKDFSKRIALKIKE